MLIVILESYSAWFSGNRKGPAGFVCTLSAVKNCGSRRLKPLLFLSLIILVSACSSSGDYSSRAYSRVPGGYPYGFCIDGADFSNPAKQQFEYATYRYANSRQISNVPIFGSGAFCGIGEFSVLVLKWKRLQGVEQSAIIDISSAINRIRQKQNGRFPVSLGPPIMKLSYEDGAVNVNYIINSKQAGTAGKIENKYLLAKVKLDG